MQLYQQIKTSAHDNRVIGNRILMQFHQMMGFRVEIDGALV